MAADDVVGRVVELRGAEVVLVDTLDVEGGDPRRPGSASDMSPGHHAGTATTGGEGGCRM